MAEITAPAAAGSKPGTRHGKKLSTRVDLTPMVDLGFLLITFFIFTTTMSKPSVMKLIMPADGGTDIPVKESNSLTLIPCSDNRVFYYHGMLTEAMQSGAYGLVNYSLADGIGQVIRDKQAAMERVAPLRSRELMLIIKPLSSANYKNVVDLLDEVKINVVKSYALTDISKPELEVLIAQQVQ